MARPTLFLALAICVLAVATASAAPSRRFLLQESPAPNNTVTAGSEVDQNATNAAGNETQPSSPAPAESSPAPTEGGAAGAAGGAGDANTTSGNTTSANSAPAAALTYATFQEAITAANSSTAGLTTLMAAVEAAGLTSMLNDTTATTILAPTDAAFERAFQEINITAQELLAEKPLVTALLSYHVIPFGALNSTALANGTSLATALTTAGNLTVLRADGNVTFVGGASNATVVNSDIKAAASIIHVIDTVLLPPAMTEVDAANTTSPAPADAGAAANTTSPAPADAGAAANMTSPAPADAGAAANAASPAP